MICSILIKLPQQKVPLSNLINECRSKLADLILKITNELVIKTKKGAIMLLCI